VPKFLYILTVIMTVYEMYTWYA